jgi:hypothetical protein
MNQHCHPGKVLANQLQTQLILRQRGRRQRVLLDGTLAGTLTIIYGYLTLFWAQMVMMGQKNL